MRLPALQLTAILFGDLICNYWLCSSIRPWETAPSRGPHAKRQTTFDKARTAPGFFPIPGGLLPDAGLQGRPKLRHERLGLGNG